MHALCYINWCVHHRSGHRGVLFIPCPVPFLVLFLWYEWKISVSPRDMTLLIWCYDESVFDCFSYRLPFSYLDENVHFSVWDGPIYCMLRWTFIFLERNKMWRSLLKQLVSITEIYQCYVRWATKDEWVWKIPGNLPKSVQTHSGNKINLMHQKIALASTV